MLASHHLAPSSCTPELLSQVAAGALPPALRSIPGVDRRLSVAPMMGYTDRHFRFLLRLLAPNALLYSEMITEHALASPRGARLVDISKEEHPVALQIGGCDPRLLARGARLAEDLGYAEVNLNVGCPSPRVTSGGFGACLMERPELVAECVAAIKAYTHIPVTVKCRLGVDANDSDEFLNRFVDHVCAGGADALIVHARIALLKELTPEQNRDIPPLNYDRVYALKQAYPALPVVINGGIHSADECASVLRVCDGVMLGRAICRQPALLAELDHMFYGLAPPALDNVYRRYAEYCDRLVTDGHRFSVIARRALPLFNGLPGAREYRRVLTQLIQRGASTLPPAPNVATAFS